MGQTDKRTVEEFGVGSPELMENAGRCGGSFYAR